jgi:hypothetical protein
MTTAAADHRDLDRRFGGSRDRSRDSRSLSGEANVLPAQLVEHTSAAGKRLRSPLIALQLGFPSGT